MNYKLVPIGCDYCGRNTNAKCPDCNTPLCDEEDCYQLHECKKEGGQS